MYCSASVVVCYVVVLAGHAKIFGCDNDWVTCAKSVGDGSRWLRLPTEVTFLWCAGRSWIYGSSLCCCFIGTQCPVPKLPVPTACPAPPRTAAILRHFPLGSPRWPRSSVPWSPDRVLRIICSQAPGNGHRLTHPVPPRCVSATVR